MEKMTLKQFWESKEKLVIYCKTEKQAEKFCEESDRLGKAWFAGHSYLKFNYWSDYKGKTCYSNLGQYGPIDNYKELNYKIINFKDIDWED